MKFAVIVHHTIYKYSG